MEITLDSQELIDLYTETSDSLIYLGLRYDHNLCQNVIVVNDHREILSLTENYTHGITYHRWYMSYQDQFDVIDAGMHARDTILLYCNQIPDLADKVQNRFPFAPVNIPHQL